MTTLHIAQNEFIFDKNQKSSLLNFLFKNPIFGLSSI
jgi:hypothetical protein